MQGFLLWAVECRWVPRGKGGWELRAVSQGCWCPGLRAGGSEAGGAPRQMPLVYCSTQPAAALGELLSSFPSTAAPGASSSLVPFCPPVPGWSHPTACPLQERGGWRALARAGYQASVNEDKQRQRGSWPQSPYMPSSQGCTLPWAAVWRGPLLLIRNPLRSARHPSHHPKQLVLGLPVTCCALQSPCQLSACWRQPGWASCAPWVTTALQHCLQCPHSPKQPVSSPGEPRAPGLAYAALKAKSWRKYPAIA